MEERRYFSRSWEMLTHDKGWIKPLLVMACAGFVPIVGELGNKGYALEWARLTAWGVDSTPKQKNVQIGQCIASGWRGFLVDLVWALILTLASWALIFFAAIFPSILGVLLSGLVSIFTTVVGLCWNSLEGVAEIRAAIYERTTAGLRFDRVYEMVKRDFHGFLHVLGIGIVAALAVSTVGAIFAVIVFLEFMPAIISASYSSDASTIISLITGSIVVVLMTCAIFGFALSLLVNVARMLCLTATGLWMRQFNVPAWGRSEDPLPGEPVVDDRPVSPFEGARPSDATPTQDPKPAQQPTQARRETALPAPAPAPSPAPTPAVATPQIAPVSYGELVERVRGEVAEDPVDERGVEELTGALEAMIAKNDADLHDMQ